MKNKFYFLIGLISLMLVGCGTSNTKLRYGGNVKIEKDNISCRTFLRKPFKELKVTECTAGGVKSDNAGYRTSYRETKECFQLPYDPQLPRPRFVAIWGPQPLNVNSPVCNAARKFNLIPKQIETLEKHKFFKEAMREEGTGCPCNQKRCSLWEMNNRRLIYERDGC
tara:strand:- start:96 stop:596 length:501 start_codon:yes stop_codon:yes gene_type:complete